MAKSYEEAEYSIAAVSKLTGASCHALRVWERRYGFPLPQRLESGHRRYSGEQVRILRSIAEMAGRGHPIGELIADYCAGRLTVEEPISESCDLGREGESAPGQLVDRLIAGDLSGGEADYKRLTNHLGPAEIVSRIIGPAWIDTGERWYRREVSIYQERIVSEFLIRKLAVLFEAERRTYPDPTRSIVVGTVQGDRHIGGVLMLGLHLEWAGWRVINLGADLPVREYQGAIEHWRPNALGLSFVLSRNIRKRFQELSQIRGLPIFVGGRSILNYQALARRHGLIPLPGPISISIRKLMTAYEHWNEAHVPRSAS
jgi:MerR family transcriptional regulator, light-induced transcriptional regulator